MATVRTLVATTLATSNLPIDLLRLAQLLLVALVPVLELLLRLLLQVQLLLRLVLVLDLQQLLVLLTPDADLLRLRLRRMSGAVQVHRRFRVRLIDAVRLANAVHLIRIVVMWRFDGRVRR